MQLKSEEVMEPGVNSINFSNKVVIFMKAKWSEMKKIYKHSALPGHEAHLINIVHCTIWTGPCSFHYVIYIIQNVHSVQ